MDSSPPLSPIQRRAAREEGFTIVDIVVALGIGGTILLVLGTTDFQSVRAKQSVLDHQAAVRQAEIVTDRILNAPFSGAEDPMEPEQLADILAEVSDAEGIPTPPPLAGAPATVEQLSDISPITWTYVSDPVPWTLSISDDLDGDGAVSGAGEGDPRLKAIVISRNGQQLLRRVHSSIP